MRREIVNISPAFNHTAHGRPAEAIHQAIWLVSTASTLGGHRRWFACPACGRRVAVIYGAGRLFACRRCKGLAYACQREGDDDRASRHADRIRKRPGWMPGILNGPGGRPGGMHWRTFHRLAAHHEAWVPEVLAGMQRRLGLINRMLTDTREHMASS